MKHPISALLLALFTTAAGAAPTDLVRWGQGDLRVLVFTKVYSATLCAPPRVAPEDLLDPATPKRLELVYHREVARDLFERAARQVLERQRGEAGVAALEGSLGRFHQALVDVGENDRYTLEYRPGRGTELRLNGAPLVTLEDPAFATAYFGIWLAEDPISAGLKSDLLANMLSPDNRNEELPRC